MSTATHITVDTVQMVVFHGEPAPPLSGGHCESRIALMRRTRSAHKKCPLIVAVPPFYWRSWRSTPVDRSSFAIAAMPTIVFARDAPEATDTRCIDLH